MIIGYTDGSCNVKTQQGGIGVYITTTPPIVISKGFSNTTTGRCELIALLYALRAVEDKTTKLLLYCDSMYVVNTVREYWIERWEKSGWEDRKNVDLLQQILIEIRRFNFRPKMMHIKGHQKNHNDVHILGNHIVDRLAHYKQFKTYQQDRYDNESV
jgi:ribonuclease HI